MVSGSDVMSFVATTDAAKALAFYQDVLGLRLVEDDQFALVFDLNGIMMRIQRVEALTPQPFTALGWKVTDIEATARQLAQRGVNFERYQGLGQNDLGIWTSPGGSRIAWFKDPDGNLLSLTQF